MSDHAWGNNRILTFLPEARQLKKAYHDDSIPFTPPRFLSIWISQICNLDCTYCFFGESNHDKSKTFIPTEPMLNWLREIKNFGAESLEFSGGGEPSLHKDFGRFIEETHAMGYAQGLITHACNEKLPVELLAKNLKYVRVGLDAATAGTHDAIKQNKKKDFWFYVAIENIKKLVALRTDGFTIGIKVVLNKINVHEFEMIVELADELNVDYVQIKSEHSSVNSLTDEEKSDAQKHAMRIALRVKNVKVLCNLFHQKATTYCFMSPIHTVVTATGDILQCCFFEDRPVGTIFQPIKEVWGGRQHREVMRKTTVKECSKVDCRWNGSNSKMKEILEDPLASMSFI